MDARWDAVVVGSSVGGLAVAAPAHASSGESLNYSRQGQIAVRDRKFAPTVPIVEFPAPAPTPPAK